MDLDAFQEKIGGISKYQVIIILSVGWLTFGQGFTSQAAVFLSAIPDHRCAVPPIDDPDYNLSEDEILNLTIPYDYNDMEYDSCNRYDYNLTVCDVTGDLSCVTGDDVGSIACDHGYHYDRSVYTETTISQFDLVCNRQYLDSIAQTLFFLGFFIGSAIVGPLSDWFGRKVAMLVLSVGLVASSIGCSFAPTYELYVFVRVLTGTCCISTFIAVFTYVSEISDTKWRTEAGAWANMTTAFSHSVYPGIAYLLRDWHDIQLTIALLPSPFIVMFFFIPETPRWLLTNGRNDEARKVVDRFAKSKGKKLTDEDWDIIVQTEREKKVQEKTEEDSHKKLGVWDLFRRPIMRMLCLNVMLSWFTISMVFYGLALNGGNLAGDPYLNNALNGLVEIAAYFCVYFAGPLGRRPTICTSFIMSGLSCIISMLCDIYANGNKTMLSASTAMAIIGKFFASTTFGIIYAVTSELFPTDVRATGISLGSMAARVGGMISPFILQLQTTIPWFTQTLFGSLSVIAGLLSLLYPETGNTDYLTSLDRAEEYYRNNMFIFKWTNQKKKSEMFKMESKTGNENTNFVENETKNGTKF